MFIPYYFILFLFFDFIFTKEERKTILVLGPKRAGKSCLINSILGRQVADIGTDDGEPTTMTTSVYSDDKLRMNLIDTKAIKTGSVIDLYFLLEDMINGKYNINGIDLILLVASLTDEAETLDTDLEKIKFIFNDLDGLNIVLTKKSEDKYQIKTKNMFINKALKQFNITQPSIQFNSNCDSSKDINLFNEVTNVIKNYKETKYSMGKLTNSYNEINEKVKKLNVTLNTTLEENIKFLYAHPNFVIPEESNDHSFYFGLLISSSLLLFVTSFLMCYRFGNKTNKELKKNTNKEIIATSFVDLNKSKENDTNECPKNHLPINNEIYQQKENPNFTQINTQIIQ